MLSVVECADAMPEVENWFTTFSEDEEVSGKSFLLQVELEGLSSRDRLSDDVTSFVKLGRSSAGPGGPWKPIGRTSVIEDDPNPSFQEGFRVFYNHETNLGTELIRASAFQTSSLSGEEFIGSSEITMRELLRTFGTSLKLELFRPNSEKICGRITFLGEGLPSRSPRGGQNTFEFKFKAMVPPKEISGTGSVQMSLAMTAQRLFLVVSRERDDGSWSTVHRTGYVKKGSMLMVRSRRAHLTFPAVKILQKELVLGKTPTRAVRFKLFQQGRRGDEHVPVGSATTTVGDLLENLGPGGSLGLHIHGDEVGELSIAEKVHGGVARGEYVTFEMEFNYFEKDSDEKQIRERRKTLRRV